MKSVVVVVLALLQSVARSQTFPYVSFMEQTLANHSYVDLSEVGDDGSGSDSVQCNTDLDTCCSGPQGFHRGDWYFPDGSQLKFSAGIHESRGAERVDLRHTNNANSPTGIYHCDIQTNAVHNNDMSARERIYLGIYTANGGS